MNQIDNAFYFSIRSAVEETCYQKNIGFTFVPYSFLDSFDRQIDGALVVGNFDRKEVDTICTAVRTGCRNRIQSEITRRRIFLRAAAALLGQSAFPHPPPGCSCRG